MQDTAQRRDAKRTAVLAAHGFEVIRFWDNDVLRDLDAVLQSIAGVVRCRVEQQDAQRRHSRVDG